MWRGVEILGELAFAAGAREILLPMFGAEPIRTLAELRAFAERPPSARKIECMSFHPLGTARMSATEAEGVVKPSGEAWSVERLYVADGSVLPTSLGVNSQLPVMAMARRIAHGVAAALSEGRAAA